MKDTIYAKAASGEETLISGKLWDILVVIGLIVLFYLLIRLYKRLCRNC